MLQYHRNLKNIFKMKSDNLLLNPQVLDNLNSFLDQPNQNLILYGPLGSGKKTVAEHLIKYLLNQPDLNLDQNSQVYSIYEPSLDNILKINNFLKYKFNNFSVERIVFIEYLDSFSLEAKNALLKVLEENSLGSLIIMTANNLNMIPKTILSRTIQIEIKKNKKSDLLDYFSKYQSKFDLQQIYYLSDGLIGLMTEIINNKNNLSEEIRLLVRQFLNSSSLERMVIVNQLSKDKIKSLLFFKTLQQMSELKLRSTLSDKQHSIWLNLFKKSTEAIIAINQNIQIRLVILKFNQI